MYSVCRNTSKASLAKGLVELFEDDEWSMTDVTLACEGQFIKAHKLVLAVNSPFFKRFLKTNRLEKGDNLLIALANVKYCDLRAVVHLMYYGEVLVGEDDYAEFAKTVKLFEMEKSVQLQNAEGQAVDACQEEGDDGQTSSSPEYNHGSSSVPQGSVLGGDEEPHFEATNEEIPSLPFHHDPEDGSYLDDDVDHQVMSEEEVEFKPLPVLDPNVSTGTTSQRRSPGKRKRSRVITPKTVEALSTKDSTSGGHGFAGTIVKTDARGEESTHLSCFCGSSFRSKHNLDRHLKDKTSNGIFPCDVCGKNFTSRRYLHDHRRAVHQFKK